MPKVRRRPAELQAQQWFPPDDKRHVPIARVKFPCAFIGEGASPWESSAAIDSPKGPKLVRPGDWIVEGEDYPLSQDDFTAKYEQA